ncbi:MAG: glycoside hydrolase family 3 C-terminal domain-containing protein [Lachnospiraceae bacterium]|nr:glycoside hydrolase family 3 C-terminal domain-containing protein [Lachnospiraceae bacterium]
MKVKKRKDVFRRAVAVGMTLPMIFGATASASSTKEYQFMTDYSNRDEAFAAAEETEIEMNLEGMILLKNQDNALPISTTASITIFGEDGSDYYEALTEGGFTNVNEKLLSNYDVTSDEYGVSSITKLEEQSLDFYSDVAIVCIDRDGISEGQDAQENWGYVADEIYTEGGEYEHEALVTIDGVTYQHQLMPTSTELELVAYAAEHCDKVIILIGAANAMELEAFEEDENVDAIMWVGQYGDNGLKALPMLLSGEVSPSGKTADFFEADFTADPTWYNYGDYSQIYTSDSYIEAAEEAGMTAMTNNYLYEYNDETGEWEVHEWERKANNSNSMMMASEDDTAVTGIPIVSYEEGIYNGYKYYETAYVDGYITDWDSAVTYPFGYGLSYTTFEWELIEVDDSTWNEFAAAEGDVYSPEWTEENCWTITAKVKVTNTGSVAGKDVVELYVHTPYISNGIAKAEVSLVAFEKTSTLNPGESEILEITFNIEDMASFDYDDANGNGYTVYELDANTDIEAFGASSADYELRFQTDSHTPVITYTLADLSTDVALDVDDYSGNDVENYLSGDNIYNSLGYDYSGSGSTDDSESFETLEESGLIVQLTRDDWEGTDPKNTPIYQEDLQRSDYYFYLIESWESYDADVGGGDEAYINESYGNGEDDSESMYNTDNELVATGFGIAEEWLVTEEDFEELTNPRGEDGVEWTQVENDGSTGTSWDNSGDEQNLETATLPEIMWRDMIGIALWDEEGEVEYTYDPEATENDEETHTTYIEEFDGKTGWECWTIFINQLEYDTLKHIVSYNGYSTDVSSIDKPFTMDADGPRHWPDTAYDWGSECVLATSWNKELAYQVGIAYANVGLWGGMDVWQGPGANIHRSHFLGRYDDYMSSDGIHGGYMTAAMVAGASSRGALVCVKHGILNDQETDRQGVRTYVNEQAAREGAFKIFQMCMQEGGAGEMMNSLACVGDVDASNNTALQEVIYEEWGWDGFIVTDGYDGASFYLPMDAMIRSYVVPMGHVNIFTNSQSSLSGKWYEDGVYTSATYAGEEYPDEKPEDAVLNYSQWYYVRLAAMRILYSQLYSNISTNGIDNQEYTDGSGMGLHYTIPYEEYYLAIEGNSSVLEFNQGTESSISVAVPEFEEWASYQVSYSVDINEGDGALPDGLTLSSDGTISGTATESGTFDVTIQCSIDNSFDLTAQMEFTVVVNSAWECDSDLTEDLENAKVGEAFSGYGAIAYAPAAEESSEGGDEMMMMLMGGSSDSGSSYTYEIADGSYLPDGLTMDEDGLITGTPTESGHFSVVINALTDETVYSIQFATSYTTKVIESTYVLNFYVEP